MLIPSGEAAKGKAAPRITMDIQYAILASIIPLRLLISATYTHPTGPLPKLKKNKNTIIRMIWENKGN